MFIFYVISFQNQTEQEAITSNNYATTHARTKSPYNEKDIITAIAQTVYLFIFAMFQFMSLIKYSEIKTCV